MTMDNKPTYLIHYASPYYDPVKAHEYYMKTRELKGYGERKHQGTLNDAGKEAKAYVKSQIDEERNTKLAGQDQLRDAAKSQRDSEYAAAQSKRDQAYANAQNQRDSALDEATKKFNSEYEKYTSTAKDEISSIQKKLENMSAQQRQRVGASYQNKIAKLREQNAEKRNELMEAYKSSKASATTDYQSQRNSASAGYKNERTSASENYKNSTSGISDAKKQIRTDMKTKYDEELDKIYANSAFIKQKSSGGRKGSRRSSRRG